MDAVDVVATISFQSGRIDEAIDIVLSHIPTTRAEEGCLRYDLYRVRTEPDTIVVLERWATEEALHAHGASEHIKQMERQLRELISGTPFIHVLEPESVDAS